MSRRMTSFLLVLATCLMAVAPRMAAQTYQGFPYLFDKDRPVKIIGELTSLDWQNPFSILYVSVKKKGGTGEEWQFQIASPSRYLLKHKITRASFPIGATITVNAYLSKTKVHYASARVVTIDGHTMQVCDPDEDSGPAE